jgi:transposase
MAEDHTAPILLEVVETFDLRAFHARGRDNRGTTGFHPTMMLTLILYCLLHRQGSARAMERFIRNDLGGRFLCGDAGVPGWRCLAEFRQRHSHRLPILFAKSVQCCMEAQLVDMSAVFGDGSKFESQVGKDRNITYGYADRAVENLQKKFDEMLAEADRLDEEEGKAEEAKLLREKAAGIPDRKQRIADAKKRMEARACLEKEEWDKTPKDQRPHQTKPSGLPLEKDRENTVEPESRLMKFRDGSFRQAYNVQMGAEGSHQIILGVTLSNDCTDPRQLSPTVAHVIETTGIKPGAWVADGGFLSEANLTYLEGEKIEAVISPERRAPKEPEASPSEPAVENEPEAASAKAVPPGKTDRKRAQPKEAVKASWAKLVMREKLATERGKSLYALRCQVIEPIFGQIKGCPGCPGMRRFSVRGLENCRNAILLQCAAHNIGKYITSRREKARKAREEAAGSGQERPVVSMKQWKTTPALAI